MSIDEERAGVNLPTAPAVSSDPVVAPERVQTPDRHALPYWFSIVLVAGLTWFTAAGVIGVLLLFLGWYQPGIVIALACVATIATVVSPVVPRPGPRPGSVHAAAVGALVFVGAFSAWAGAYHSEHLLVERDPAVYINLGRTVADQHRLDPKTNGGPFDDSTQFSQSSPSLTVFNGQVTPGFFHMLPAVLAVGFSIGGDTGMLVVPAILGGLGLLALYALASRIVGPRWALVAPILLGLAPLQLWFSRDAYSELIVQPLVLGGLWLFLTARSGPALRAAVAGVLIGATVFARIDALAFVACSFPLAAIEWIRAPKREEPAARRRAVLGFVGGLGASTLVAILVTRSLSAPYLHVLRDEYHQLVRACIVALLGSIGIVVVAHLAPVGLGRSAARSRILFGAIVALTAALFVYFAEFRIKPVSEMPRLLPRHKMTAELRTAINEWHWRYALRWFFEYFGMIAIIVAIAGLLLLLWRALRGSGVATSVLWMVVPVTVLYIWRPNITADQPWAMRRYLPATLPAIAIGVTVVLSALWLAARGRRAGALRVALRAATVVLAIAVAVPAAIAGRPFAKMRMQDGALTAVHDLCRAAGSDAAILILGYNYIDLTMPATFRAFCGTPAAKPLDQKVDLQALAQQWQERGRRLLVATAHPPSVEQAGVNARQIAHVSIPDGHEPEQPFNRRPRTVTPRPTEIWLYEIPASRVATPAG